MQDPVLKKWCQAMLQAFSSCAEGCPPKQLACLLDLQLQAFSTSSWASLFGSASADGVLARLDKLDSGRLQVVARALHVGVSDLIPQ